MANASFFEKKEVFERGVAEVRTLLRGRDVTTVPRTECGALSAKYEHLATLARELCDLSRTSSSKEQYTAFAVRLSERASTLKLLSAGKSPKATPDEKRRTLLEEFERRTQDIKKRLRQRTPEELTGAECEALSKKYEKLALVARQIAEISRTVADDKKYSEFYERLMCRVAELNAIARKKNKKGKVEEPTPKRTKTEEIPPAPPKPKEPTPKERARALQKEAEAISSSYEKLIRAYQSLEEGALSDAEREEYAYFIRYFTESAEFFEAVRKKEIKTLSPDEILSLQTK